MIRAAPTRDDDVPGVARLVAIADLDRSDLAVLAAAAAKPVTLPVRREPA